MLRTCNYVVVLQRRARNSFISLSLDPFSSSIGIRAIRTVQYVHLLEKKKKGRREKGWVDTRHNNNNKDPGDICHLKQEEEEEEGKSLLLLLFKWGYQRQRMGKRQNTETHTHTVDPS